jgi:hypothetical protein
MTPTAQRGRRQVRWRQQRRRAPRSTRAIDARNGGARFARLSQRVRCWVLAMPVGIGRRPICSPLRGNKLLELMWFLEAAMARSKRQADSGSLGLTRAEAAKRLGRHESWVRRREGKELHPTLVNGVNRFALSDLDALAAKLEAERRAFEASETATIEIHRMFDLHLRAPMTWCVETIAEKAGVHPRVVRSMFAKWADEFLSEVPRLLSRRELQAIERREEQQDQREHEERMAQWEREHDEWMKRVADERKRQKREQEAADAARAKVRALRRKEWEESLAKALSGGTDPGFQDQITRLAEAKTLQEVVSLFLELCARN